MGVGWVEAGFHIFQGDAAGFRQAKEKEEEAGGADGGVGEEGSAGTEGRVEDGEGVGEQEAGCPQSGDGNGHGAGADAGGEDFGNDDPGDGGKRHGIARDSSEHQQQHGQAGAVQVVEDSKSSVDEGETGDAGQQQNAAAVPVDCGQGNQGEDEVDCAGDDDVEEDVRDLIAGGGEDFLRVVEDDVDAAPLLEDGEQDAEEQDSGDAGRGELSPD